MYVIIRYIDNVEDKFSYKKPKNIVPVSSNLLPNSADIENLLHHIIFSQVKCAQLGTGDDPATKQLTENLEKMQNRLKTLDLGDSLEVPFDSNFLSVEQYGYNEAHPRGRFIRANRYSIEHSNVHSNVYSNVYCKRCSIVYNDNYLHFTLHHYNIHYVYMYLYWYLSIFRIKCYKMMVLYVTSALIVLSHNDRGVLALIVRKK